MRERLVVSILTLVTAASNGCSKTPPADPNALPAGEVAPLKEAVANATTTVQARKQSLASGFTDDARIKASSQSDTTKTPCPRTYKLPDAAAMATYVKTGNGSLGLFYEALDLGKAPVGKNVAAYEQTRSEIADALAKGKAMKGDLARLQAAEAASADELIFDSTVTKPIFMGSTFMSGNLYATAYLFSYAENRIICAGKLDVKNSSELELEYTHNNENMGEKMAAAGIALVERDLDANIAKAVSTNLYATWKNDQPPP